MISELICTGDDAELLSAASHGSVWLGVRASSGMLNFVPRNGM